MVVTHDGCRTSLIQSQIDLSVAWPLAACLLILHTYIIKTVRLGETSAVSHVSSKYLGPL